VVLKSKPNESRMDLLSSNRATWMVFIQLEQKYWAHRWNQSPKHVMPFHLC